MIIDTSTRGDGWGSKCSWDQSWRRREGCPLSLIFVRFGYLSRRKQRAVVVVEDLHGSAKTLTNRGYRIETRRCTTLDVNRYGRISLAGNSDFGTRVLVNDQLRWYGFTWFR